MQTITSHDLANQLDEILRRVFAEGESYNVTDQGEVVARLVPVRATPEHIAESLAALDEMDQLAQEIARSSPGEVDAVQIVHEQRRDL